MHSEPGRGSVAQIRLPLTLAITNALLVEVDGRPYAIALDRVERSLSLDRATVRSVGGNRMLVLRDGVLPIVDAGLALGMGATQGVADHAVLVRAGERRIALAVSRLVGQQELVTRPLPAEAASRAVSAAAVLSDGTIALVVDCDALSNVGASAPALTPALQEA
jgi:two-component system chemotaxis sensor kinase CheA